MFRFMRTLAKNKMFQIIFGTMFSIGFISWGVSSYRGATGADTLVSMKGGNITLPQFQAFYQRQLQQQNLGNITSDQAKKLNLPEQILGQMVIEQVLANLAKDMGLNISNRVIARAIAADPIFQDPTTKQFSKDRYLTLLKQNGISEHLIINQTRSRLNRTWLQAMMTGTPMSLPTLSDMAQTAKTIPLSAQYIVVDGNTLPALPQADDKTLQSFYDSHQDNYRRPAYRQFSLLILPQKDLMALATSKSSAKVTEATLQQYYQSHRDEFTNPAQYQLEQLLFASKKEADDFYHQRPKNNTSPLSTLKPANGRYTTLNNISDNDLGNYGLGASDPVGTTTGVRETSFGFAILRLQQKKASSVTPFATVKPALRQQIIRGQASQTLNDIYRDLSDALAGGKDLAAIAQQLSLPARPTTTALMDNNGRDKNGQPVNNSYMAAIAQVGFGDSITKTPQMLQLPEQNPDKLVLIALTKDEPATLPPLNDAKKAVLADWQKNERFKQLQAEKQRLDGDMTKADWSLEKYQAEKKLPLRTITFSQQSLLGTKPILDGLDNGLLPNILFQPSVAILTAPPSAPRLWVMKLLPRMQTAKLGAPDAALQQQLQQISQQVRLNELYRRYRVVVYREKLNP